MSGEHVHAGGAARPQSWRCNPAQCGFGFFEGFFPRLAYKPSFVTMRLASDIEKRRRGRDFKRAAHIVPVNSDAATKSLIARAPFIAFITADVLMMFGARSNWPAGCAALKAIAIRAGMATYFADA
jgi:hypothetical protein